jgi:hypothetical protein
MESDMKKVLLLSVVVLIFGCAAHTNLVPMGRGNIDANVSIGGPIVKAFGARIPVPYATAGVDYGLYNRTNIGANLHLLSLAYQIVGADLGATFFPLSGDGNRRPTIGLQPRAMMLFSTKSDVESRFKCYPELSASAAWAVRGGQLYLGSDVTFRFSSLTYDKEASSLIFSPFVGYQWRIGHRTSLLTECKWHGANFRSDMVTVDYLSVRGHGAISTLFAIVRSF